MLFGIKQVLVLESAKTVYVTYMFNDFLKTVPQFILPKKNLSQCAGLLANVHNERIKNWLIKAFIERFQVNMGEALAEEISAYPCFNDFFIRKLKPDSRVIEVADIISPVDGILSEYGSIQEHQLLQAKGKYYALADFLVSNGNTLTPFINGQFLTFYLSPRDYHRVHMPFTGCVEKMVYVPGKLFSVQPATTRIIPKLFARNERLVIFLSTANGPMIMVMVGATIVGAMATSWEGEIKRQSQQRTFTYPAQSVCLQQAEEMGYFKLGSTVILVCNNQHAINWDSNLYAGCSVRYGQKIGNLR